MIIALLIAAFFGGGGLEVLYIDKIEKGVNIYVTDKDRKKELHGYFKEYQKTHKGWNKRREKDLKELKKQNLDRAVSISWYEDFFEKRLDQTAEVQANFIDYRINLQKAINEDEWAQIIELASSAEIKEQEKAEKQANKKKSKDLMDNLRQTANEIIVNPDSKRKISAAQNILKEKYDVIVETYEQINVEDNAVLVNKNVTEEELEAIVGKLGSIRAKFYESYVDFIIVSKENTSDEEYKSIMNEIDKLL